MPAAETDKETHQLHLQKHLVTRLLHSSNTYLKGDLLVRQQ
jgi:hypothetical protein